MADRATKSGIALEAQQKIHSKYSEELASQILQWVQGVTGLDIDTSGRIEPFIEILRDGKVLCQLANSLEPGSVKKVNSSSLAFKQMENIG